MLPWKQAGLEDFGGGAAEAMLESKTERDGDRRGRELSSGDHSLLRILN